MVARIKAAELPATSHLESPELVALANRIFLEANIKGVLFVLNNIQNSEMENYLRMELLERCIQPIGVIHNDSSMSIAWLKGEPLAGKRAKQDAQKIARALEAAQVRLDNEVVTV
jgi:CO dehydrogenase nickel-insertion accessory protein CooC1